MPKSVPTDGTGIDGILSADRTFSTSQVINAVLEGFDDTTQRLARVGGLRLGVIDHGDYESRPYTNYFPMTTDLEAVRRHLKKIQPAGGSGRGANYAQALQAARQANWTAGKSRFLILAGDEIPRPPKEYPAPFNVDAYNEIGLLKEAGVKIFAVQLLGNRHATGFYRDAAQETGGVYLPLDQMYQIPLLVTAICLLQESPTAFEAYAEEVAKRKSEFTTNMERLLNMLGGRGFTSSRKGTEVKLARGIAVMDPSRFQLKPVRGPEVSIADFVQQEGLLFRQGRGFYLHDYRPEEIAFYKEIVLRDRVTGTWYCEEDPENSDAGRVAIRNLLGIDPRAEKVTVRPNPHPDFDVFVQSTSSNRTLNRGGRPTWLAYEPVDQFDPKADSRGWAAMVKKRKGVLQTA